MQRNLGREACDGFCFIVHGYASTFAQGESGGGATTAACAKDDDMFSCEIHRIFKSARPISAKIMESSQKRMMTWLSCQPPSSK